MSLFEERVDRVVDFCETKIPGITLTESDDFRLVCYPEHGKTAPLPLFKKQIEEVVYHDEDMSVEEPTCYTIEMEHTKAKLSFTIDNYVHVTHLVDGNKPESRDDFNLHALASRFMPYYVEFSSKKKFAKVNQRYHKRLSHLIYSSRVIVETGSNSQRVSRQLLRKTIRRIRDQPGYRNVKIKKRHCKNIVSKGRFTTPVALSVLKKRFQDASYNKKNFPGLVIRLKDLERYLKNRGIGQSSFVPSDNYIHEDEHPGELEPLTYKYQEDGSEDIDDKQFLESIKNTNDYRRYVGYMGEHNTTFLVFRAGQIICTGSKSEKALFEAYRLLFHLLDECSAANEDNRSMEQKLDSKR